MSILTTLKETIKRVLDAEKSSSHSTDISASTEQAAVSFIQSAKNAETINKEGIVNNEKLSSARRNIWR